MIKINLLPVKRKKKAKPLPTFLLSTIGVTVLAVAISLYLIYFFNARLSERKATVARNDAKIKELQEKIKAADEYEKKNAVVLEHNKVIEELTRNRSVPVKILDTISTQLPVGVWINNLDVKGGVINLSCVAFTNTDVVNYVNNLKNAPLFADVYLIESIQDQIAGIPVYKFKLKFAVKV